MNRKRVMFVFGTRPEAIKMAPVVKAVEQYRDMLEPLVVVTGQHRQMLDQVLKLFAITPDYDLEIMEENQTITGIVTKSLRGLEEIILREKPEMILVQGDTSTAFAAGLAAFYYKIPLGHIEAGLRTFDKWRPFPEEMNRKMISDLADLHFPPTATAMGHLLEEKVPREKIYLTGNTVIDALLDVAGRKYDLGKVGIKVSRTKKNILVTTHRRESFGEPIRNICAALKRLADTFRREVEFIIPVHRNPLVKNVVSEMLGASDNIKLIEPLDYEPFVHLMKEAYIILTDSGGVQEEAPSLGKPVLVMREKTERPEAIAAGSVKLVGMDEQVIFDETTRLLTDKKEYDKMAKAINPYGDGQASRRIVASLLHYFGILDKKPEEFNAKIPDQR
ncbi:MAG: UDP-N-acetylglucosamine 2-epimerase (non-hydrolyzing) [Candidatus Margulisbacteria bacterium]|nr:UDP-N-acetylglucosamine 2-epimerase (non-hydrolyzing) [Candidatus Margulisiibacteriota bacterium]